MRRSPKDFELAVKIGDAYVKCHLYTKVSWLCLFLQWICQAINFYEAAMNTSKQPLLRLRFAEQLLRLQNYEKCERVLRDVIDEEKEPSGESNWLTEFFEPQISLFGCARAPGPRCFLVSSFKDALSDRKLSSSNNSSTKGKKSASENIKYADKDPKYASGKTGGGRVSQRGDSYWTFPESVLGWLKCMQVVEIGRKQLNSTKKLFPSTNESFKWSQVRRPTVSNIFICR